MKRAVDECHREGALARLSFLGWMGRSRGAMIALLGCATTIVALCGCETTMERSAALQRVAKHTVLASRGISVTKENLRVRVLYTALVHSSEGVAVAVGLRNNSKQTLVSAPIEITVRDAHGSVLFQNNQPGLDPSLTRVASLPPGAESVWVDDQVQASGVPASASALVGEATSALGEIPRLSVTGAHLIDEGGAGAGEAGMVTNRSKVAQEHLVVYALARRGPEIVAAGRAILPEVPPGASAPFQLYFVGDPKGTQIEVSAPVTTF